MTFPKQYAPPSPLMVDPFDSINRGRLAWWPHTERGGTRVRDIVRNRADTITGATWASGRISPVLSYAGAEEYNSGTITYSSPYVTFAAWVNADSFSSTGTREFFARSEATANSWEVYSYFSVISTRQYGTASWNYREESVGVGNMPSTGVWFHLVAMFDATTTNGDNRVFINGAEETLSVDADSKVGSANFAALTTEVGAAFNGDMGPVSLWNRQLKRAEIKRIADDPWAGIWRPTVVLNETAAPAADTSFPPWANRAFHHMVIR